MVRKTLCPSAESKSELSSPVRRADVLGFWAFREPLGICARKARGGFSLLEVRAAILRRMRPNAMFLALGLGTSLTIATCWRRERDSNPRYGFPYSGFQDRLFQPLTHPSAACSHYCTRIPRENPHPCRVFVHQAGYGIENFPSPCVPCFRSDNDDSASTEAQTRPAML